jgi:hypothetical protein
VIRTGLTAVVLFAVANLVPSATAAPPWIVFPTPFLNPNTPSDPFPIRRVFLPANRTPEGIGSLVRMTRTEFEQKVRVASDALQRPPSIAAAQYTVTVAGDALVGTAEWTVRNPSGRNGLVALDPHRLALTRPRWSNGSMARLIRTASGDEAPKTFAWLEGVNAADGSRLQADWSLRATGKPGESRFELRVPPAGIASLTLFVPNGLVPRISAEDALVTGPIPDDDPTRKRWRIVFGGRSALDLVLTRIDRNHLTQPGLVKSSVRLTVGEGRAEGTVRFDLDPNHEPGDAYFLDINDRMIVQSVVADVPIDWTSEPRQPNAPHSIRIVPREGGRIGRLNAGVVVDPPVLGKPWALPALRIRKALPSETTVQLRLNSDIRPILLDSGDFRLTESDQTDAGRTLAWTNTLVSTDARERQWPTLTFASPQSDLSISERAHFMVGNTDCFLRVTATIAVQRGPVSTLSFTVPESYRTAVPPTVAGDTLAKVHYEESKPARWVITLSRPLATGQSASISFSLSSLLPAKHKSVARIGIPAVIWPSTSRSGSATVSVSPVWAPVSALVVAYQDLPPAGELFLREAEPVVPANTIAPETLSPSAGSIVAARPERIEARIGDRSITMRILGVTGLAGDRTRVNLPPGSTIRSVRLVDRAIDQPHLEAENVILPACLEEAMPFEIQVEHVRSGTMIERFRWAWPDGEGFPIRWHGETNWLVATWGNGETAYALRRQVVIGLGWILAAGLLISLANIVCSGPSRRRSFIVLFAFAAGCGSLVVSRVGGTAFVPPLIVSLVGLFFLFARKVPTVAVAAVLLGVTAEAAAPQQGDVYLKHGTGGESQMLFAYAPKALLDRLDRMAGTAEPDVAILSARYIGNERMDESTFRAEWTVYVPPGGPHRLNVPLTGTKLESVLLDRAPAFPEPLPNGGFLLTLSDRGTHVVSAVLAMPIRTVAREREIRFLGPDVPLASIEFTAKSAQANVDVSSRRGKQSTAIRDGLAVTTAELGDGRTIAIRWRAEDSKPVTTSTDTTLEAAVWDIDETEATLTAAIQFPANHGAEYRIRLPAGLSLVRASARAAEGGSLLPVNVLQTNDTVIVTPLAPVEGKFTVVLILVPDRPVSTQTRFAFPRALDRPDPSAVYAIRLNGLVASEFGRTGVIDIPIDTAARAAIPFPELNLDARPATRAYRRTAEPVELAPRLSVSLVNPQWTSSMTWTIGDRADVFAEWQCAGPLPGVVSFAIPPNLTLASLRGPDVIDTMFADGRSKLWLRTNDEPGPIRLVATMPRPINGEWNLPVIRPPHAGKSTVRIRPVTGYAVRVLPATGVTPTADGAFEIGGRVDSLRVEVSAVDPPKLGPLPVSPQPNATPIVSNPSPVIPASTAELRPSIRNVLIWLGGMTLLGIAFARPFQMIRPELILVWGVLAWIAWSPLAAVGVVIGVAMRIGRSLREAPSPAR